jgi:hypothetical protein
LTDREFIYSFLEENFSLKPDNSSVYFFDKENEELLNLIDFKKKFSKIIGIWKTDEQIENFEICIEWYENKKKLLLKDISDYLADVKITLGDNDWIIEKPNGIVLTDKFIINKFKRKYPVNFIINYYDEHCSELIHKYSENLINKW